MSDAAVSLFKITIKGSFVFGVIMAFIVVFNVFINGLLVGLNAGVLTDIFAIVSIWMPFNLGMVITWLLTVSLLFLTYRAMMVAFDFVARVLD